jgi:hypothetical protein
MSNTKSAVDALRRHFALGPVLALYVDRAEGRDPMERTAWEAGVVAAATAFDHVRSFMGAAQAGIALAVGWAVTNMDIDVMPFRFADPWPITAVVVFFIGVIAYWTVPTGWAVVAFFVAPVKQRDAARRDLTMTRNELTATKQRVETSLDLRDIAWIIASESISLREALTIPEARDQLDIPARIEWFRDMADRAAAKMEQSGLADRADGYRVRRDDEGRLLAPSAIDNGRLESVNDLLNMMNRYQLSLVAVVREYVGQLVQP